MSMQALLIRATFMAMLAIGLSLAMIHTHANRHSAESTQTRTHPITHASVPKVQTTHAHTNVLMLPTIHVRGDIDQLVNVDGSDIDITSSSDRIVDNEQRKLYETLTPSLHRLRLDMPYYSFGRAIPRASKE